MKEIADVMNADRSPICAADPPTVLSPKLQNALTQFSLVCLSFFLIEFLPQYFIFK